VTTVPSDPDGKRQHMVETCNFVDAGTSILLRAQVRDDFRVETAFDAVVAFLRRYGLPQMLTFDRDPRWVGSQSGRDFPSAFRRFLLCLGIHPNVCPPHQQQKQAYVERYHRSYKYECLLVHRPGTLQEASDVTRAYQEHYSWQRPHQGRSCHNVPPHIAHPDLPHLPALPFEVDPDRWVDHLHGRAYVRHVGTDGCVTVDERSYYWVNWQLACVEKSRTRAAQTSGTSAFTPSSALAIPGERGRLLVPPGYSLLQPLDHLLCILGMLACECPSDDDAALPTPPC
jgi:hypothetical protein